MSSAPLLTANRVTMLRMLMLPFPVVLLYRGTISILVAMLILIVMGLTDILDGYLARKHGSTTFGRFLDPLADKLMIGAMFLPLVHQGFLPAWIVAIMFAREFLVTDLRTFYTHAEYDMVTSETAKIKTYVQMMAGSVILLCFAFHAAYIRRGDGLVAIGLTYIPTLLVMLTAIGLWISAGIVKLKGRRVHSRLWVAMALWTFMFFCLLLLPMTFAAAVMAFVVMLWSAFTGVQYLAGGWSRLRPFLGGKPIAALTLALSGLVLPIALVFCIGSGPQMVALLYLLVMTELAAGGLENFLSMKRAGQRWPERLVKLVLVCAALLMFLFTANLSQGGRGALALMAFAISLYYVLWYASSHWALLRAGSESTQGHG